MLAAASTIAVVYPHMNSIGGDGFWIVHVPDKEPIAIDACGASGRNVDRFSTANAGLGAIPQRGTDGCQYGRRTISGWERRSS